MNHITLYTTSKKITRSTMFTQMCKKYINIYYVCTWRRNIRCKVWNEKQKSPFNFYFLSDSSQSEKKKKEKKITQLFKTTILSRYRRGFAIQNFRNKIERTDRFDRWNTRCQQPVIKKFRCDKPKINSGTRLCKGTVLAAAVKGTLSKEHAPHGGN